MRYRNCFSHADDARATAWSYDAVSTSRSQIGSRSQVSSGNRPGAFEVIWRVEFTYTRGTARPLVSCQRGPVRHLTLIQPGAQMRLGDAAGSRHRTLGVLEALPGEVANSFLDYGHRLVRGLETGRHVADGGARVADEVRESRDLALVQDLERAGGVWDVGSRRDHASSERPRPRFVDHPDACAGNEHVRCDREQLRRWAHLGAEMLDQPIAMSSAELEQLVDVEARRTPDAAVDGRERYEPSPAHGQLHRGRASNLAEALDGSRAIFESPEGSL